MLIASDHQQDSDLGESGLSQENLPTVYACALDAVILAARLKCGLLGSTHNTLGVQSE